MPMVGGSSTLFRVLALLLRPFVMFFGVTALGHLLLRSLVPTTGNGADGRGLGFGAQSGYLSWLTDFFTPDAKLDPIIDALPVTAQVAIAGTLLGVALGVGLGGLMRLGPVGPVVSGLSAPMMSFAGPGLALGIAYWLGVRFSVIPVVGSTSLLDDPAEALRLLIGPALIVGLALAPSIAAMVSAGAPYTESFGLAAAASGLGSRSEQRSHWRFGFPAGALVTSLFLAEMVFNRAGVFRLILNGIRVLDLVLVLNTLAVIVLGGVLLATVVDVAGLVSSVRVIPTAANLRLSGYQSIGPTVVYWVGAGAIVVVIGLATLSGAAGADPSTVDLVNADNTLAGPGSEGHLLGTDSLGRDVLGLALKGLGPALTAALAPSFLAVIAGYVLETIKEYLGPVGELFPGTLVDAFWWPLPLLLAFAALSADNSTGGGTVLTTPSIQLLFALGLVPLACRILRRETIRPDVGEGLRVAGIWALLAGFSLTAYFTAAFAGFDNPAQPSLGSQMAGGLNVMADSAWPAGVPAVISMLLTAGVFTVGACLVRLGWYHSATAAAARAEAAGDLGDSTTPIRISGLSPIDTEPLAPNYGLQPGVPAANPWDNTVTLPTSPIPPPVSPNRPPPPPGPPGRIPPPRPAGERP